jgi:hypothetical protein
MSSLTIQTFLGEDYLAIYPDDAAEIDRLRVALLEYAKVVQRALEVHKRLCKDIVFHEALRSRMLHLNHALIPSTTTNMWMIADDRFHALFQRRDTAAA